MKRKYWLVNDEIDGFYNYRRDTFTRTYVTRTMSSDEADLLNEKLKNGSFWTITPPKANRVSSTNKKIVEINTRTRRTWVDRLLNRKNK